MKIVTKIIVGLCLLTYCSFATEDNLNDSTVKYRGLSFGELDKKATQGTTLNVVFIGGSLSWGAAASNPQIYSTRALVGDYLIRKYPQSAVRLFDASIGSTGSNLGLFRLERDVLSHNPSLVFVDCTVNDGLFHSNKEQLYTYETLIRRLIVAKVPVVQIIFGVKQAFEKSPAVSTRRTQHLKLQEYYNLASGDVYPEIIKKLENKEFKLNEAYLPNDSTHPDDFGYALFAEAIIKKYEEAVKKDISHKLPPKPMFGAYEKVKRVDLYKNNLPQGWKIVETLRTGLWFDGQASRWMDKLVMGTSTSAPLKIKSYGSFLGILGEASESTATYYVRIDGKKFNADGKLVAQLAENESEKIWKSAKKYGSLQGNIFFWEVISQSLTDSEHEIEVVPLSLDGNENAVLKIGSICFASGLKTTDK